MTATPCTCCCLQTVGRWARCVPLRRTRWHIGRVAVIQSARQLHLGRRMMDLAEAELRRRGAAGIEVSAQCRVQPFYEKCGFTSVGEVYLDEFCPHIRMVKEL